MKTVTDLHTCLIHYQSVVKACDRIISGDGVEDDFAIEIKRKSLARYRPKELLKIRDQYERKIKQLKQSSRLDKHNITYKRNGQGLEVNWFDLYQRRDKFMRVPENAIKTMAIDVQADRFEIGIEYWNPKTNQNYKQAYCVFVQDLNEERSWITLWRFIKLQKCDIVFIDSGYMTRKVYEFSCSLPYVFPIKGQSGGHILAAETDEDCMLGLVKLIHIGTHAAKTSIYQQFHKKEKIYFRDLPAEYFKQLAGEKKFVETSRGRVRVSWVKLRERNEALDLSVYNLAAYLYYKNHA